MLTVFVSLACLAVAPLAWGQTRPATPSAPPQQLQELLFGIPTGPSPYLGVGVIEVNAAAASRVGLDAPAGVEIANVAKGSPAAEGGLAVGDVVTKFRGEPVQGVEHFVRLVRETPIGRSVELELASSAGRRTAQVVVGERSPAVARRPQEDEKRDFWGPGEVDIPRPSMLVRSSALGATLESVSGPFAQVFGVSEGVLVREVEPAGAAASAGLQPGDVIVSIEGRPIVRTSDIRMTLSQVASDTARVEVMRAKVRKRLAIPTGRKTFSRPFEGARQVSRPN